MRWSVLRSTVSLFTVTLVCGMASAQAPTKQVAATPVYCAVTGEKIGTPKDAFAKKTYNGNTYYLCCPGCAPKFDAAPAKYAKLSDLRAEKRALEARLIKINADLKAADAPAPMMHKNESSKAAQKLATVASSELYCPVTGEKITSVKEAAGSAEYNGKTYYFCCPGCDSKFKAEPTKYVAAAEKRASERARN